MNKNTFYIIVIVILFLSNITMIGFILSHKPKDMQDMRENNPKRIVIEKLHFDKNQAEQYEQLIDKHQKDILQKDEQIISLKNNLYKQLTEKNDDVVDSLTTEIAKVQKEIETIHYNHFLDIKSICHPNQIKDYDELAKEIERIFSKKPPKR